MRRRNAQCEARTSTLIPRQPSFTLPPSPFLHAAFFALGASSACPSNAGAATSIGRDRGGWPPPTARCTTASAARTVLHSSPPSRGSVDRLQDHLELHRPAQPRRRADGHQAPRAPSPTGRSPCRPRPAGRKTRPSSPSRRRTGRPERPSCRLADSTASICVVAAVLGDQVLAGRAAETVQESGRDSDCPAAGRPCRWESPGSPSPIAAQLEIAEMGRDDDHRPAADHRPHQGRHVVRAARNPASWSHGSSAARGRPPAPAGRGVPTSAGPAACGPPRESSGRAWARFSSITRPRIRKHVVEQPGQPAGRPPGRSRSASPARCRSRCAPPRKPE